MTEKRFTTNGYYIYDYFKEEKWLVNEVEVEEIVMVMNNLDTKARERSKALSKLQKENEQLNEKNKELKQEIGDLGTAHAEEINKIEDEFYEEILKLEKENEQLKKHIEEHSIDEKLLDDLYFNQVGGI